MFDMAAVCLIIHIACQHILAHPVQSSGINYITTKGTITIKDQCIKLKYPSTISSIFNYLPKSGSVHNNYFLSQNCFTSKGLLLEFDDEMPLFSISCEQIFHVT